MTADKLLEKLRTDSEMTESEYMNFCKRYAERNIASVMWYLSKMYGKLPKGIAIAVRSEMKAYINK